MMGWLDPRRPLLGDMQIGWIEHSKLQDEESCLLLFCSSTLIMKITFYGAMIGYFQGSSYFS